MIGEAQNAKWGVLFSPQVADGAAFAANGYIDTLGWGYAEFLIQTGTLADTIGTTTASTAIVIEECETTGGTYTEIAAAVLAAAIAADGDDKLYKIDVNLQNRTNKRYMRIKAPTAGSTGAGAYASALARLSKPMGVAPSTATERGLAANILA